MSLPDSGATTATRRAPVAPISDAEMKAQIKSLKDQLTALVKVAMYVGGAGPGNKAVFTDPEETLGKPGAAGSLPRVLGRKDVNDYAGAFKASLEGLGRLYAARGKKVKSTRAPSESKQLYACFFVSDQLINFFRNSQLGPWDVSKFNAIKEGDDPIFTGGSKPKQIHFQLADGYTVEALAAHLRNKPSSVESTRSVNYQISALFRFNICNALIFTSLMSLFRKTHQSDDEADTQTRIIPNEAMLRYFGSGSDCVWRVSDVEVNTDLPSTTPKKVLDAVAKAASESRLCCLDRIKAVGSYDTKPNKSGKIKTITPWKDRSEDPSNWGLDYTQNMVLTNLFRIPNAAIASTPALADRLDLLKSTEVVAAATAILKMCQTLTDAYNVVNYEVKRQRAAARSRATAARKRAASPGKRSGVADLDL